MDRLDKGGDHDSFIFLTTFYKHQKENKDGLTELQLCKIRLDTFIEGFEISSSLSSIEPLLI